MCRDERRRKRKRRARGRERKGEGEREREREREREKGRGREKEKKGEILVGKLPHAKTQRERDKARIHCPLDCFLVSPTRGSHSRATGRGLQ